MTGSGGLPFGGRAGAAPVGGSGGTAAAGGIAISSGGTSGIGGTSSGTGGESRSAGQSGTAGATAGRAGAAGIGGFASSTGGVGGTGASSGNGGRAFTGSPCVTTDFSSEFVFGHGTDGAIYERAFLNSAWLPWTKLTIDSSNVDPASALDCAGNPNIMDLVATSMPPHQILHTTGSGSQFSPFSSLLQNQSFDPPAASVAVLGAGDSFYMFGAINFGAVVWTVSSGTFAPLGAISGQTNSFVSAIHVAVQANDPAQLRLIVGLETSGQLALYGNVLVHGADSWESPVYLSPPAGRTFGYSPTICVDTQATNKYTVHVAAATTDGGVWDSYTGNLWGTPFSSWEHVGDGVASSVDCTMMTDESVHIVSLDASGHIAEFQGTPGSWQKTDLGGF